MTCTYQYDYIDLNDSLYVRYKKVSNLDTKILYMVYRDLDQKLVLEQCQGCDSWCSEYTGNCNAMIFSFDLPDTQQRVTCKKGYFPASDGVNQCIKCIDNCDTCYDDAQCYTCSEGFALGLSGKCYRCSEQIKDCNTCYLGNGESDFEQFPSYINDYSTQDELDADGFSWRCSKCDQKNKFYIPSLDMNHCEECLISNCKACRYASIQGESLYDHTMNPFTTSDPSFTKYCTLCENSYFINYNGQCESCSSECSLCYYGTLTGSDILYTLEHNFLYKSGQDNLQMKCYACIYDSSNNLKKYITDFEGQCTLESQDMGAKDSNCVKWRELNSIGSLKYECLECKNGYGINMSDSADKRTCSLFNDKVTGNLKKCLSFYYSVKDNVKTLITCTKCETGYSPLPSGGCVNCSSGIPANEEDYSSPASLCNNCHFISTTGVDFSIILQTQQFATLELALSQEKKYEFPDISKCIECSQPLEDGGCPSSCQEFCVDDQCNLGNKGIYECNACTNVSFGDNLWTLSEGLSNDNERCLICPRYCDFCIERTVEEVNNLNPYFKPFDEFFSQFQQKCLICKSVENACYGYNSGSYDLNCNDQATQKIVYDTRVNQCFPCSGSECSRKIKIRQIIECRQNQAASDNSSTQAEYYKKLTGLDEFGDEILPLSVIFLEKWNPTQQFNVDFSPYNEMNDKYQQNFFNIIKYQNQFNFINSEVLIVLNGEGISAFEFEILLIPEENVTIKMSDGDRVSNTCRFPNEIIFSNQLAKFVANISTISLSFSILTSAGVQPNASIDLLYTNGFSFSGWNEYYFSNINFIPLVVLKNSIVPQEMVIKFSDNLFVSKLTLDNVQFLHGITQENQVTTLSKLHTNCYPVIEIDNLSLLQLTNVKLYNFVYAESQSLFRFDVQNKDNTDWFEMKVNSFEINKCAFNKASIITLASDTATIILKDLKFLNNKFVDTAVIKQASGHDYPISQHSVVINGVDMSIQSLSCFQFVDAYNLLSLVVSNFAYYDQTKIQCGSATSMFTTNVFKSEIINFYNSGNSIQDMGSLRILSLPKASPTKKNPSIQFKKLTINGFRFSNIKGQLIFMEKFSNEYSPYFTLILDQVSILNSKSLALDDNNLVYLKEIDIIQIKNLDILDSTQISAIFADQPRTLDIINGSYKRSVAPNNWDFKNNFDQNLPDQNSQEINGNFLYVKRLINRAYIENFEFSYLLLSDSYLIQIQQTKNKGDIFPSSDYTSDLIEKTFIDEASTLDTYAKTIPRLILNDINFNNIFQRLTQYDKQMSLINIQTSDIYRYILYKVIANNISGETIVDSSQWESVSFLYVDSIQSFLHIKDSTFQTFRTVKIQNGFYLTLQKIFLTNSKFIDGNMQLITEDNSLKGGFFYIYSNYFTASQCTFQKIAADQGGAIYFKGISQSFFNIKDNSVFDQIYTTFNPQTTNGDGGAIYFDSSSSDSQLTLENSIFSNIFANYTGGVLQLQCGMKPCLQYIQKNQFISVFATSGSIFNVKYKKSFQKMSFSQNEIQNNMEDIKKVLTDYYKFGDLEQEVLKEQIQTFYLMVIQGGSFFFFQNTISDLHTIQGLIYGSESKINFFGNKISSSSFYHSPYIYVEKSQFDSSDFQFITISQCTDCSTDLTFNFLKDTNDFSSFLLISNPSFIVTIDSLHLENVVCPSCSQGLVGITSISKDIRFNEIYISFSTSKKGMINLQGTPQSSRLRQLAGTLSQVQASNLHLLSNNAEYGGAIYASNIPVIISNSEISKNTASNTGGGIYYIGSSNLKIQGDTQITLNNANFAGGIKIIGGKIINKDNFSKINFNNLYQKGIVEILTGSLVSQNKGLIQGSDIVAYPIGLKLLVNGIEKNPDADGVIRLKDWVSGTSVNQGMAFQLISSDNKWQYLEKDQTATLVVELDYPNLSEKPAEAKISGTYNANYDSQQNQFILDKIELEQFPLTDLKIKATSSAIQIPTFNPDGSLNSINKNYKLQMVVSMRKCIIGEAFIESSGNCFTCSEGTYSIIENSKECLNCPKIGVDSCPGGKLINLSSGYWRPAVGSDLIEECFNFKSNCNGGLQTGDGTCSEGHVGALCEVCDISGRFWGESYSFSSEYKCGKCSEITGNTLKMIGLSIYTLIAIVFSVRSTKALLDSYIITFYLQKINFIPKKAVQSQESVGIIIKIFTTYIQLLLVIQTFKLKLPPGISDISTNVGDPVQQMSFSMDCALYDMSGSIPITYFRLLWSQFMPIIYISLYLIGQISYTKFKRHKYRSVIVWISVIYMYISMQPSIVRSHIQTASCRFISGENYIKADVSQICYTSTHIGWILAYILPTLIVWIVLIPLYFLLSMYKGRDQLGQIQMQYRFGFLYSEYKLTSYFWEIVKIYQKTLVTIFINIFDQYVTIKGILVIFILIIYITMQRRFSPYLEKRFNDIDLQANITVIISVILAIFVLNNPFDYQIWLAYIVLVVMNAAFIIKLLRILISGFTSKFEGKLMDVYLKISLKYPRIGKFFNLPKIPKQRIKQLWKMLRTDVLKQNKLNVDGDQEQLVKPKQDSIIQIENIEQQQTGLLEQKGDKLSEKSSKNLLKNILSNGHIKKSSKVAPFNSDSIEEKGTDSPSAEPILPELENQNKDQQLNEYINSIFRTEFQQNQEEKQIAL